MKTKISYIVLIIASVIIISCKRNCDKTLDKFSRHEAFNYFAFEHDSKWYLSNNDSSISINFENLGAFSSEKRCRIITVYGMTFSLSSDSLFLRTLHGVNYGIKYNKKSDVSICTFGLDAINTEFNTVDRIFNSNDFDFNSSNTTPINGQTSLYFEPQFEVNGSSYNNVAVTDFVLENSVVHVKKFYLAPYVGPVQIEMSDGRIFKLDSSDVTLVDQNYFSP